MIIQKVDLYLLPLMSEKDSYYIPLENSTVIELEHLDFEAKPHQII